MHYHHHEAAECEAPHGWPDWVLTVFATIKHLEVRIMAQQDQLNADVQTISDALTGIAQEITDLKAQLAAQVPANVDLSGLDAIAAKAQSLVPAPAPAPVTTPTDSGTPTTSDGTNPAPTL